MYGGGRFVRTTMKVPGSADGGTGVGGGAGVGVTGIGPGGATALVDFHTNNIAIAAAARPSHPFPFIASPYLLLLHPKQVR